MILKELDIKQIINRKSVNKNNTHFVEYSAKELLNLIQTYIYEKKNIDVKEIKEPQGNTCGYFITFMIKNNIDPLYVMQKGKDYDLFDYMSFIAIRHYINKFKE